MSNEKKPVSDPGKGIKVKIDDNVMKGSYANNMIVAHSKEEFICDFLNIFPPNGIVTARIIVSPAHMKRMLSALSDNLAQYEKKFGVIDPSKEPGHGQDAGIKYN